ncbi:hypothetical protein ACMFMG_009087 [Clarireedia jacksonii]
MKTSKPQVENEAEVLSTKYRIKAAIDLQACKHVNGAGRYSEIKKRLSFSCSSVCYCVLVIRPTQLRTKLKEQSTCSIEFHPYQQIIQHAALDPSSFSIHQ